MINGHKYLLSLDEPMMLKDGFWYSAIWGSVNIVMFEDLFGFRPHGSHANYVIVVGNKGDGEDILIGGCRAVKSQECPEPPECFTYDRVLSKGKDGNPIDFLKPSIFYADKIEPHN